MTVTFKLERLDATPSVQDQLVWRPGDRLHLALLTECVRIAAQSRVA
jgi:hypothetical protein